MEADQDLVDAPQVGVVVRAVVAVLVAAVSAAVARSAASASITSARWTTRTSLVCAAMFPSAARSSHDASLAPVPGTSAL